MFLYWIYKFTSETNFEFSLDKEKAGGSQIGPAVKRPSAGAAASAAAGPAPDGGPHENSSTHRHDGPLWPKAGEPAAPSRFAKQPLV
jgi:hypothetical protein